MPKWKVGDLVSLKSPDTDYKRVVCTIFDVDECSAVWLITEDGRCFDEDSDYEGLKKLKKKKQLVIQGLTREDDYIFFGVRVLERSFVTAGCRVFGSYKDAKKHWSRENDERRVAICDVNDDQGERRRRLSRWSRREAKRLFELMDELS